MSTANPSKSRYTWLDAGRVIAACLIVMIHTATDPAGRPFSNFSELARVLPVLSRLLGELASTELFILISAFVAAVSLNRKHVAYWPFMQNNAKRLLKPFVFWTVFYILFSLYKAYNFGYFEAALLKISDPLVLLRHFLFGTSKYQMHFLPTMFMIMLFMPVMMLAIRHRWMAVLLLPLLFVRNQVDIFLYANLGDLPFLRDFLVRVIKILSYTGYGFFAAGAVSLIAQIKDTPAWREQSLQWLAFSLFLLALVLISKATYGFKVVESGSWLYRSGLHYYAHYLTPVVFILFMFTLSRFNLSENWSRLSGYSFGLYLIHPVWIDVFDIGFHGLLDRPLIVPGVYVALKYSFVLPLTFFTAYAIRLTPLAWTIGLSRNHPALKHLLFWRRQVKLS